MNWSLMNLQRNIKVHHGEIESLVVASYREVSILLCDNFAPWYLQRTKGEILTKPKIAWGYHAIDLMLAKGLLTSSFIENLEGTYPKKNIKILMERYMND